MKLLFGGSRCCHAHPDSPDNSASRRPSRRDCATVVVAGRSVATVVVAQSGMLSNVPQYS